MATLYLNNFFLWSLIFDDLSILLVIELSQFLKKFPTLGWFLILQKKKYSFDFYKNLKMRRQKTTSGKNNSHLKKNLF